MRRLTRLPQRLRIAAWLGAAGALYGAAALGFVPLMRSCVSRMAAQRGLQIDFATLRLGWGAIWLRDVDVRVPSMPGVRAEVNAVRVALGWRLGVSDISVHGGSISVRGDVSELKQQYAAYRSLHSAEALARNGALHIWGEGLDLAWTPNPPEHTQYIWGLRYEREGERERLALDMARLGASGLELEARHPEASLRRMKDARELESLRAEGVDVAIILSGPQKSEPHFSVGARSSFRAQPALGAALRAGLLEVSLAAQRAFPVGASLDLGGVRVRLQRGAERLNVGPSSVRAERLENELDLALVPKAEAMGTPLEVQLFLPLGPGEVRAEVRGGPVSLRSLGIREGDFGLINVQAASLQAHGELTLASDGADLSFSGGGVLDRMSLVRDELSPMPLSGVHLAVSARGTTTLDGAKLVLNQAEIALGAIRLQGSGVLSRSDHALSAHWSGGVPLASCQALLDAAPRGLVPLISTLRMTGTFAVNAQLDYDSERASDTRVLLDVANDCQIAQIPADLSPRRFASAWQREVKGPDQKLIEIESGPGSPDWVPYDAISPFVEAAVLVCEDGHFQRHRGFDYEAIQNSIRDDLVKGRFVRGASTITMQLAKNLYLGKEKTLGRKLQEAVLTQLLEQELSKRDLMELYLNVIEYGPGIYGIGPAARYYFSKKPSDLSLGQALYIASILPNPEHQHFDRDGRVSPAWSKYLQRLMHVAKKIGRVSEEQLLAGLAEQVAFRVAGSDGALPAANEDNDTPSELSP